MFTLHEHLGSPLIIAGVRVYPSRAPGFSLHYWWGSCLPFTSTWVHPPLLVGFVFTLHEHLGSPSIIGGVRVYPSRAAGFTLDYWWGSCLPFTSTWVHPWLFVGFVLHIFLVFCVVLPIVSVLFYLSSSCVLYPMLSVSLDCPFLIALSVFPKWI